MDSGGQVGKLPVYVVMASYNGERYLDEQLTSILAQSCPPNKIIVSDDRSSDRTAELLNEYVKAGLVELTVNEQDRGVIGNFKHGVAQVQEPAYVALSDQDDIWLSEKLELLSARLKTIDDGITPAMIYSDLSVVDRHGKVLNHSFWNELGQDGYRHSLQTLLFGNFVTGCTILMNPPMAKYFMEMPPDVPMHDAWLALIAFSFGRVDAVSKPLVHYRKHENNVAHSEAFKKESKWERRLLQIKSILFGDEQYLKRELAIAEKFYHMYHEQLSIEQKQMFDDFLALKGKSFLEKKLAFRKAFKGYWR